MQQAKIYELGSKLERWSPPVEVSNMTISISSNGRIKLTSGKDIKILSFIESITFMDAIIRGFKSFDFQVF
jgi:hypothetical protein